MVSLDLQTQWMVYIITYSQADTSKFPTRESFIQAIIEAWKFYGINILHWVVCIEAHANLHSESSDDLNYYHFHMAVKWEKRGRWLQVKKYLNEKFTFKSISVITITVTIAHIRTSPKKILRHYTLWGTLTWPWYLKHRQLWQEKSERGKKFLLG